MLSQQAAELFLSWSEIHGKCFMGDWNTLSAGKD